MNETKPPPAFSPLMSLHVAVIGAGGAGLAAARELVREGHSVVVYEKGDQVGGTWVYTPQVESDLLGVDPNRVTVHSSLYKSLRINFPRELMGFRDFPFVSKNDHIHDTRRFAGHEEVLLYLQNFAREFCINEKVRLRTEVVNVSLLQNKKWKVRSRKRDGDGDGYGNGNGNGNGSGVTFTEKEDIFDAVVVCNGHYSEPLVAEIPGISLWPGKQMHSHNYRVPDPFQDQVVILIGNKASAFDIKRELSHVANEVHIVDRSVADETYQKQPGYDNMWLHSTIERANQDGTVVFRNGKVISADVILHCTGYKYHFPFLKDVINSGVVTVDESHVGPLYKHVFPPVLSPWLSFVGIPQKVIPFPLFEFQSKWIARVLSRRILLPSENEMMEDIKAFNSKLEASGKPKRHIHHMSGYFNEYMDWLTALCSSPGLENWRKEMEVATVKNSVARPGRYRDEWDDDDLVAQAQKDFIKYTQLTVPMSNFFSHTLCR